MEQTNSDAGLIICVITFEEYRTLSCDKNQPVKQKIQSGMSDCC